MITLDVRPEVVVEAIERNIDLLIAKHPPIFRPVRDLVIDSPQTKMYADLFKTRYCSLCKDILIWTSCRMV